MPAQGGATRPIYLHDGQSTTHSTTIISIQPLSSLPEADRALFKQAPSTDQVLTTSSTIFYPQGGGQPSDIGHIRSSTSTTTTSSQDQTQLQAPPAIFLVSSVRHANTPSLNSILHCGHFSPTPTPTPTSTSASTSSTPTFPPNSAVTQSIDPATRTLHSRIHTAGHILGTAVALMKLPNIDEGTRAMHFPASAFVDFKGLIDGTQKDAIQAQVDELVRQDRPVHIRFWDWDEARAKCNIAPDEMGLDEAAEPTVRAVEIEGAGAYPCGGTHVERTGEVGRVVVRRITRSKGTSKISYSVS